MQLFSLLYEMIGTFYYVLIFCNVIIESIEYHLLRSYNNCRNILWHRTIFYDVLRFWTVVRMANICLFASLKQLTWRLEPSPCSVLSSLSLPRFKLFNLFTPTPGRLGHNSSVIVFFWENKPGSWLPQNCLLPVFWLVRCSQLRPLIGQCHTEHLGTEHQRSHILPSSDVCCNNQLSLYPANKGSRFGSDDPDDPKCP